MNTEQQAWLKQCGVEDQRQFMEYWNSLVRLRGVKMRDIIDHGWGAGLHPEQVLHECMVNGYAMCVAEPAIKASWAKWDADYAAYCATQEDGHMYAPREVF